MSINKGLAYNLPLFISRINRENANIQDVLLKEYGLTRFHTGYLLILKNHPDGKTLKEMTDYLSVDKANTTRAIKDLEKKGYAIREKDVDKFKDCLLCCERNYKIFLTEKGIEVSDKIIECMQKKANEYIGCLSKEEQKSLEEIFSKIISACVLKENKE